MDLQNKKVNLKKLLSYGFARKGNSYIFTTTICDNQFELTIKLLSEKSFSTKLVEKSTQEEYTLHLTDAVGAFVGGVRTEYKNVLQDVVDKCFDNDAFKSRQAKEMISYIEKTYGDNLEFLWEKFPKTAIWRRKDNQKWYGALMTISKRKLKLDSDEQIEIIDLRSDENLIDNKTVFEGYHMNKKHWITICLNGSMATRQICKLVDRSFELAKKN